MSAFLPLQDPDHPAREIFLRAAREEYRYNYTHVSPLAILDRVPFKDEFSVGWLMDMAKRVAVVFANRAELELHDELKALHHGIRGLLGRLVSDAEAAVRGLKRMVGDALRFDGRITAHPTPPRQLEDYAELFRAIGLPPVAKDYAQDDCFAGMRVAGPNPVMLKRLAARDPRFPLADADFLDGDSFDAALAEGRLYLADYAVLQNVECGDFPHGRKYLEAPLALFVVNKATKRLAPVAIQCRQQPGSNNPIFTPKDGWNWLIAKTIVEIADGNVHEAATHLGRTHLLMEPFAISTFRQLAPNHPLALLLGPHFQGQFAINDAAWRSLIADKGGVDKLMGGNIRSSRLLAGTAVCQAKVQELYLPKTLADRGVNDRETLPDYPYRDDTELYYAAIQEWVAAYLALYYTQPSDLFSDNELHAWVAEIASTEGGRIAGLPNEGAIHNLAELTDLVTFVIFTCSVQHAAVNFPQYDLMSYAPMMPLASYRPAPASKAPATQDDYLAMLPPMDMAELQMELGYLLGTLHYTQLGQYESDHFRDPRVAPLLEAFQQRLGAVNATIAERNLTRRRYETLAAAGIPQSINV
ncbi:MAG: lipoxygenase family protein [Gemmataceae bacterium]